MVTDEFGDSTFNMSLQTLKRMDNIKIMLNQLNMTEFVNGNPLYYDILQAIRTLYSEVRPQLKEIEKKKGDAYRTIFKMRFAPNNRMLIDTQGGSIIVIEAALPLMEEWLDWINDMMYAHKISMAVSEDLGDVIE